MRKTSLLNCSFSKEYIGFRASDHFIVETSVPLTWSSNSIFSDATLRSIVYTLRNIYPRFSSLTFSSSLSAFCFCFICGLPLSFPLFIFPSCYYCTVYILNHLIQPLCVRKCQLCDRWFIIILPIAAVIWLISLCSHFFLRFPIFLV